MPSSSCCFLHVWYIVGNQYQTESKRSETFCGFFWARRHPMGQKRTCGGAPRGAQPTRARLGAQARPGGLCPPCWPPAPPLCETDTRQPPYATSACLSVEPVSRNSTCKVRVICCVISDVLVFCRSGGICPSRLGI